MRPTSTRGIRTTLALGIAAATFACGSGSDSDGSEAAGGIGGTLAVAGSGSTGGGQATGGLPSTSGGSEATGGSLAAAGSGSTGGGQATGGLPSTSGGSEATGGTQGGAICDPCQRGSDCGGPDDDCLTNNDTGETFCSQACSSPADCPPDFSCQTVDNADLRQCIPPGGTCQGQGATGGAGGTVGSGGAPAAGGSGDCDPGFMGPFCEVIRGERRVIGYDPPVSDTPTLAEVREYSLGAVNAIRATTCLPPLVADSCLDDIGTRALDAVPSLGIHGYFIENCMNQAHAFGDACECDWAQENYGMGSSSASNWTYGIHAPLCGMMDEPKGEGHRGNIESAEWTRLGVGVSVSSSGADWCHEFGR